MADFDSIINVEEWISDYYLTTDEKGSSFGKRVADAVNVWKSEEKVAEPPTTRLTSRREALQKALSALSEETDAQQLHGIYDLFSEAFGYSAPRQISLARGDQDLTLTAAADKDLKTLVIRAKQLDALEDLKDLELLDVDPQLGEKPMEYTAAMLVRELFLTDKEPDFILILAGNWVIIAEKERWPLGRYLAVNLALAIERNDQKAKGEMQRITAILAAEHTLTGADGKNWWLDTLEEARDHAVRVSEELRGAIKRSIEIIGNDILDRHRKQEKSIEDLDGIELGNQALRYLYRILFLLFAESSPELQILPTGDNDYDEGYGLARLRDQILTEPTTLKAQEGTHLFDSLQLLFNLVNTGHDPKDPNNEDYEEFADESIQFRELDADLFSRAQTSYIDEVKLSNLALTKVLQNLLLTKEKRGSDRGFISYATLGVSELGQVYESLMSFKGFIAKENLIEVAKHGDASKGSWVVPDNPEVLKDLPADSVVEDDVETEHGLTTVPRRHKKGSFVFRQSSRDRERSASFYSPPVITKFTVSQAIEELEATGRIDKADDILTLSICEPAMGSGAFAVEAVDQLAELYIEKKQKELGKEIPGDDRPRELQKVKAHIALHQVYGVDLNKTAVELAEISLWLNTMTADLKAPWFGLRLRHGNSLVGATRSTFTLKEISKRDYLDTAPKHHSLTSMAEALSKGEQDSTTSGRIYHFLVPSKGWGASATVDAKEFRDIAGDEIKRMKNWQKEIRKGLNKQQQTLALSLSSQAERLWEMSLVRLRLAEDQVRRDLDLFGQEHKKTSKNVMRKQIEEHLFANKDSAYQRLRLAMNLWNALWYWPVTATEDLPSIDEYLSAMHDILGTPNDGKKKGKQSESLGFTMHWEELDLAEEYDRVTSGRLKYNELLEDHPWVEIAEKICTEQAFFHWDLDFATVMSRGGFDFQVGNPPWVRPRTNVDALFSEHDPWFNLAVKPTQQEKAIRRASLNDNTEVLTSLAKGLSEIIATSAVLTDGTRYPHLKGQQPDLYRGFMERTWVNVSKYGIISLIHPESHFSDTESKLLRAESYLRLRSHWQFANSLLLFDIDQKQTFGINTYGPRLKKPDFKMAAGIYHPRVIEESLQHDGSGELPGFKDSQNRWDLRPHKDRVITVNENVLSVWNSILEERGTPLFETRTLYSVNSESAEVLAKLANSPRLKELCLQFSSGWHESADKKAGYFDTRLNLSPTWSASIVQPRHIGLGSAFSKEPTSVGASSSLWREIDIEGLPSDYVLPSQYEPLVDKSAFHEAYNKWEKSAVKIPSSNFFRVSYRERSKLSNVRTMYCGILPPGPSHINSVNTVVAQTQDKTTLLQGFLSSLLIDFFIRSAGSEHMYRSIVSSLPYRAIDGLSIIIIDRVLRLNCLTSAYAPLWEEITDTEWTVDTPLRVARDRWHAQNEIDAMVALSLGVTLDELLMIYRTQFPVMRRYDQEWLYDANGRRVAGDVEKKQKKAGLDVELPLSDRTWTHPQSGVEYVFEYPFAPLDREADLRECYSKYSAMLEADS